MAEEVILPRVDMDMTEGKIAFWHVANGDTVRKGQVLFEMETSKATMEVEAESEGVIEGIRPDEMNVDLPVGKVVAWMLREGEALPSDAPSPEHPVPARMEPEPAFAVEEPQPAPVAVPAPAATAHLLRATPLARSIARERGITLDDVRGSGERGRIVAADLEALSSPSSAAPPSQTGSSNLHLQWFVRGEGVPLVLLHGFGSDLGSWRPLMAHLPGQPALGIDLPNHGKSPRMQSAGFDALAQDIAARLDSEGMGPLHLVGHSLGGGTALAMAALLKDRLRSLTLLAPAGFGPEIHGGFIQGLLRSGRAESLRPWLALLFGNEALLDGSFVATAAQQLRDPDKRAAMAAMAERFFPDGTQAENLRTRLATLSVPAKLIWGTLDRIAPPRQATGLPGQVALHLLPGIGHLPQIEAPALLATLLRQQVAASTPRP